MAYTVSSFLKTIIPMAQEDMKKTGVLASLTIAQALLESGYGNSGLTTSANNLFGIKGEYKGQSISLPTVEYEDGMRKTILAKFRKYPSWVESLEDHSKLLTTASRYAKVVSAKNYKEACDAIQKSGYSTNPTYGKELASIIDKYDLDQYDIIKPVPSANPSQKSKSDSTVSTLTIALNGIQKQVSALNIDGFTYVKLRDLEDAKIQIGYDDTKNMPTVTVKA